MAKYKRIPVTAAKAIAEKYGKEQVIIVTWDAVHGKTHVTTYGKSLSSCKQAAQGGNFIKKALGWPPNLCDDQPRRVKNLKELREAVNEVRANSIIYGPMSNAYCLHGRRGTKTMGYGCYRGRDGKIHEIKG